ncbi:hypothetical protein DO021_09490 [Desulfobacter hydrogenophilus]|uniref:Uncharacterized protein n=1 Tax=Desulfobacter hydrogenophilus TaxID=2291 RepID=A0A328FFG6_9BACT|nr:hypothetical protein DO021_09490 [Desulfobacter hydrogenophilus]
MGFIFQLKHIHGLFKPDGLLVETSGNLGGFFGPCLCALFHLQGRFFICSLLAVKFYFFTLKHIQQIVKRAFAPEYFRISMTCAVSSLYFG